jgi:CheY-like chemotaxis protein
MGRRVLVVDDDRGVIDTLQTILTMAGYDCATSDNGNEALELVCHFDPHLVISDVMMPGMSGVELALELKNSHPQLRIILLSGHANTQELLMQAGESLGPVLVLPKPFPPRDLLKLVAELTDTAQIAA